MVCVWTCPNCGNTNPPGHQCLRCGAVFGAVPHAQKSHNNTIIIVVVAVVCTLCLCPFGFLVLGSLGVRQDAERMSVPSEPPTLNREQPSSRPGGSAWESAPKGGPDLEVLETHNDEDGFLCGTVRNNTSHSYKYVHVAISLTDDDGSVIGSTMANVSNLDAGATWKFRASAFREGKFNWSVKEVSGF